MKKAIFRILIVSIFIFFTTHKAFSHCEIPCGIYNDEMRIDMILEHAETIEKSMQQIIQLEKQKKHNSNQLIRWVFNKEDHADKIQAIVSQYFMTQRIKTDTKDYNQKLGLLHQMLIVSMKCKQTTDISNVTQLRNLVNKFKSLYFK